jgi:hypothetical protein
LLDEPWDDDADELPKGPAHRRRRDRRATAGSSQTLAREPRRLAVLAIVGALLVLAGFGSGSVRPPAGATAVVPAAAAVGGMPVVVAAAARSSAWYCPGPLPIGAGADASSIVLTGTADSPVQGRVTIVRSDGGTAIVPVVVPAHGSASVPITSGVAGGAAGWAAASVELDGGGVGAEQVVAAPNGPSGVACEVTTSSSWYFPAGSTAPGADVQVALYNPTAAPAIANLSFAVSSQFTTSGVATIGRSTSGAGAAAIEPPPFQGITVPPGQLLVIDVGRQVQLQPELATTVTATSGRVVAGEWTTVILGATHEASLTQGVAQSEHTWWFPLSTTTVPGADAIAFWLYNPSAVTASAELLLPVGAAAMSTIAVSVPAESLVVVSPPPVAALHRRSSKAATPPPAWAEVESTQAGIVVARDGISEVPRSRGSRGHTRTPPGFVGTGLPGAVIGAAFPARAWLLLGTGQLAAHGKPALGKASVAVTVPSSQATTVSVTVEVLAGGEGAVVPPTVLGVVTVAPGMVTVVDLPVSAPSSVSLLLVAGGPIVAERDYAVGGSAGSLDSIGIPVD